MNDAGLAVSVKGVHNTMGEKLFQANTSRKLSSGLHIHLAMRHATFPSKSHMAQACVRHITASDSMWRISLEGGTLGSCLWGIQHVVSLYATVYAVTDRAQ